MSENTVTTETSATPKYSVEYILEQLDKIATNTTYLLETIKACSEPVSVDVATEAHTRLEKIVVSRETTNQRLIAFYEEMYRDLRPTAASGKEMVVAELLKILNDPARSPEDKDRAKSILQDYMLG